MGRSFRPLGAGVNAHFGVSNKVARGKGMCSGGVLGVSRCEFWYQYHPKLLAWSFPGCRIPGRNVN